MGDGMKKNEYEYEFTPKFTPADLEKLPSELKLEGEKLRTVYEGFERIGTKCLDRFGFGLEVPYAKFLKSKLNVMIKETSEVIQFIDSETPIDLKARWFETSLSFILAAIHRGHWKLQEAHMFLKQGNIPEYSDYLAQAGVSFGRLTMMMDLSEHYGFERLGSIQNALSGAALGGAKSGETRRKQSGVPIPKNLRIARQTLLDAGKPPREIAAMLAKKYSCTTDHIRKLLKRD